MGKRTEGEGETSKHLATWLAMRRMHQEDWIIHENVTRFDTQLLVEALGELYHIDRVDMDAANLGHGATRARAITVLIHKKKNLRAP